jgi:hypothetical protein
VAKTCRSLTITAPTGKAKQVDLVAANLAIIKKYSSQVGLFSSELITVSHQARKSEKEGVISDSLSLDDL